MTFTELQDRAKLASIGFWVIIAIHFLTTLASAYGINLFGQIENGRDYDYETLTFYDGLVGFLALLNIVGIIYTAVTFVRWMLAAFDILIVKGMIMPYERSFIAWAFFIPFANLVRPYQAITSIFDGAIQMAGMSAPNERSFVLPWWLLYIFGGLVGNISARLAMNAESLSSISTYMYMDIVSSVMFMGSAWLILQIISSYTEVVGQAIENDRINMIGEEREE